MEKNEKKKSSFFSKNYRLTNLVLFFFSYLIILYSILSSGEKPIFLKIVLPLIISFVVLIIISIVLDIIIGRYLKYLDKKNRKIDFTIVESQNIEQIDPKLKNLNLSKEKYDRLVNFRISNILIWIIIGLLACLLIIDFQNSPSYDIILIFIMISGVDGIIAVIFDFIIESIIKVNFKKNFNIKKKKRYNENIFTKNKRIYYVPIYIILGIINCLIFIDFNNTTNIMLKIVFPLELITILDFILMLITDYVIARIDHFVKIVKNDTLSEIDEDLSKMIDEELKKDK